MLSLASGYKIQAASLYETFVTIYKNKWSHISELHDFKVKGRTITFEYVIVQYLEGYNFVFVLYGCEPWSDT
jgi:hypothetical protein